MNLDPFDIPLLPGLAACPDLVGEEEERELVAAIQRTDLEAFRFQRWEGKRVTISFGWSYHFDDHCVLMADPLPDWLPPVRNRMARFAGIYEHVVGLSLGAPAKLRFRRIRADGRFDQRSLPLPPRGAYHMFGEARREWWHSIAEMNRRRWSIAFRSASQKGLRALRQTSKIGDFTR